MSRCRKGRADSRQGTAPTESRRARGEGSLRYQHGTQLIASHTLNTSSKWMTADNRDRLHRASRCPHL